MTADILYYTMAVLLVLFSAGCWALNLFSIPGNWIMIALATLFAWLMPTGEGQGISWEIIGTIVIVGLLAELVEFAASAMGAAQKGASRRAMVLAIVGTMIGGIMGAAVGVPIPIVGPIIGAVGGGALGAFTGAWIGESWVGKSTSETFEVSKAAMIGKLLGTLAKLLFGAIIFILVAFDAFI